MLSGLGLHIGKHEWADSLHLRKEILQFLSAIPTLSSLSFRWHYCFAFPRQKTDLFGRLFSSNSTLENSNISTYQISADNASLIGFFNIFKYQESMFSHGLKLMCFWACTCVDWPFPCLPKCFSVHEGKLYFILFLERSISCSLIFFSPNQENYSSRLQVKIQNSKRQYVLQWWKHYLNLCMLTG